MERLVRNIGGLLIGAVEAAAQAVAQITQEAILKRCLWLSSYPYFNPFQS